jgi:rubrerythrin
MPSPFDGSSNPKDIRTFYRSELDYLRAMQRRYSCQFCGTSPAECPSCRRLRERIKELADA